MRKKTKTHYKIFFTKHELKFYFRENILYIHTMFFFFTFFYYQLKRNVDWFVNALLKY
jgi:hypothetical protein